MTYDLDSTSILMTVNKVALGRNQLVLLAYVAVKEDSFVDSVLKLGLPES